MVLSAVLSPSSDFFPRKILLKISVEKNVTSLCYTLFLWCSVNIEQSHLLGRDSEESYQTHEVNNRQAIDHKLQVERKHGESSGESKFGFTLGPKEDSCDSCLVLRQNCICYNRSGGRWLSK